MTHGVYLVTGKREYRGHKPGTTFEAQLEPGPESRAIGRGDIRLLRRVTPQVEPGTYELPDGWLRQELHPAHTEAAKAASVIEGGG